MTTPQEEERAAAKKLSDLAKARKAAAKKREDDIKELQRDAARKLTKLRPEIVKADKDYARKLQAASRTRDTDLIGNRFDEADRAQDLLLRLNQRAEELSRQIRAGKR